MFQKIRYGLVVLSTIVVVAILFIPVAANLLENSKNYLPIVLEAGDTATPTREPLGTPVPPSTDTPSPTPEPTSTNTPSPTPEPTSTDTPIPTDTPTPIPTEKPSPVPSGDVRIIDIFYDGEKGSQEPDEYVEIKNFDSIPIQLDGWTLRDEANHVFTFPSFIMETGKVCRVYTNEIHTEWCGFSYGSGSAIWNNGGDCADLRNLGGTTIDNYCY